MCGWARQNSHITPDSNCAIDTRKPCCGGETKLEQQKFARTTKYTFVANEDYMFSESDTDSYHYIVILRRSIDRYISHHRHVSRENKNVDAFAVWMQGQPDNWITRHLCGTPCQHIGKYGLQARHVIMAYSRLAIFDDILFLEQWQKSVDAFLRKHAWISAKKPHLNKAPDTISSQNRSFLARQFLSMTALDDFLYQAALNGLADSREHLGSTASELCARLYTPDAAFQSPCGVQCSLY
jgi:hypothetical protein